MPGPWLVSAGKVGNSKLVGFSKFYGKELMWVIIHLPPPELQSVVEREGI